MEILLALGKNAKHELRVCLALLLSVVFLLMFNFFKVYFLIVILPYTKLRELYIIPGKQKILPADSQR